MIISEYMNEDQEFESHLMCAPTSVFVSRYSSLVLCLLAPVLDTLPTLFKEETSQNWYLEYVTFTGSLSKCTQAGYSLESQGKQLSPRHF